MIKFDLNVNIRFVKPGPIDKKVRSLNNKKIKIIDNTRDGLFDWVLKLNL